jgi:hypothetical protein
VVACTTSSHHLKSPVAQDATERPASTSRPANQTWSSTDLTSTTALDAPAWSDTTAAERHLRWQLDLSPQHRISLMLLIKHRQSWTTSIGHDTGLFHITTPQITPAAIGPRLSESILQINLGKACMQHPNNNSLHLACQLHRSSTG